MSLEAGPALSNRAIFLAALDVADEHERREFLDQACGSDFQRRQQIERLLAAHHAGPRSPLARAIEQLGPAETRSVETPSSLEYDVSSHPMIGPYKLREQIGAGGFGVVYVAEQSKPVRRKVALKVIKPGMDSKDVIARFEAERQALALMDHPNVARVLDAGATESGRPYFVMELVKGVPITEFCDASTLTNRQRLTLFIDVCRAVQHAHQKGIIHRDLKPSNILVTMNDDRPMPKVIDFGIAKALSQQLSDHSVYTAYGQVVGTPLYMSPEQAHFSAHDVDTRSDVYSLGVLLYELLTGTTPFDRETLHDSGWDEMRRLICEVDPPRPSARISTLKAEASSTICVHRRIDPRKLSQSLHGELDWIIMKALEKDRNRRYESASALADDVARHLSDEAVVACPPSLGYRLKKSAKRNRPLVIASALVTASLLMGMGVSSWQAVAAMTERNRAIAAEKRAKVEARISAAVNAFLNDDLLAQASPETQPDPNITLRAAIERAADQISEKFADQPVVEAAIRVTLAKSYDGLGDYEKARQHAERSLELRRQHLGSDDAGTIESGWLVAAMLRRQGDYQTSREQLESLLARARRELGDEAPVTFKIVNTYLGVMNDQGEYASAETLARDGLQGARRVLGHEHPDTIRILHGLGVVLTKQARYADSEQILKEAVDLRQRTLGHEHPDTLLSMIALSTAMTEQSRHAEAEGYLTRVLEIQNRVLGAEHPSTLGSQINMAVLMNVQGRYSEAETLCRNVLQIQQRRQGTEHPDTLMVRNNLSVALYRQGRIFEAAEQLETMLEIQRRTVDLKNPAILRTMANLASALASQNRFVEAERLFRESLEIRVDVLGRRHPDTLRNMVNLATTLMAESRYGEAEELYRETLELQREELGEEHPDTLQTMHWIASIALARDRFVEAETRFRDLIEVKSQILGKDHREVIRSEMELAVAIGKQKRLAEAEHILRIALDKAKRLLGSENPLTLDVWDKLAGVIADQGDSREAEKAYREICELRAKVLGDQHPKTLSNKNNLAVALGRQGKFADAERMHLEVLEIRSQTQGPEHPDVRLSKANLENLYASWSWRLSTAAEPLDRRPQEAVELARKALQLNPESTNHWNNLGVALYRTGEFRESVEALENADRMVQAESESGTGDRAHRMFLAMSHWQLGHEEAARELFAEGAAWIAANRSGHDEHERFRAEAAQLLGLTEAD